MQNTISYLKPPQEVYSIRHDSNYIKQGEGNNRIRRIFYNQQYDDFEEEKIEEVQKLIKENNVNLPPNWTKEMTCKYVYSGGFNAKKSLEKIKKHLEWREDHKMQILSEQAEELLRQGYIYQFGRDRHFRPIIYIRIFLVGQNNTDITALLCAATNLLRTVQQNMFVQGFVENWIVIMDFNFQGVFSTPISTLSKIYETLALNYTSHLFKYYIINTTFLFHASWKILKSMQQNFTLFLDVIHPITVSKVSILSKNELYQLNEFIDPSQIEQKYGGTHPNLDSYWPIRLPNQDVKELTTKQNVEVAFESQNVLSKDSRFYSIENDSDRFFLLSFKPNQEFGEQSDSWLRENDIVESQFEQASTTIITQQSCCNCKIF